MGNIEGLGFAVSSEGVEGREVVRGGRDGRCDVVEVGVGMAEVSSRGGGAPNEVVWIGWNAGCVLGAKTGA